MRNGDPLSYEPVYSSLGCFVVLFLLIVCVLGGVALVYGVLHT